MKLTDNDYYLLPTAFYAVSLTEYHMEPHSHESCEIMYVTSGSCRVSVNGTGIRLSSGQFIFINSGITHALEFSSDMPCAILNLEFGCQTDKTAIPLAPLLKKSPGFRDLWYSGTDSVLSADTRSLGYALKDLLTHLQGLSGLPSQDDFLCCLLFYRMALELAFCAESKRSPQGIAYLKKACDYIDSHYLDELSIPQIARYVGIHKSYLQALFTQRIGCTINTYINQKRLSQAAFLLCNSDLDITEIAFSAGYNSRQHFAYTFEKFYQLSPSVYRRLHGRTLVPDTAASQYQLKSGGATKEPLTRQKTAE